MSTTPLRDRIATGAGIEPARLTVGAPTGFGPSPGSAPAVVAHPDTSVLNVSVDETLPIITMGVQAPDQATARRLIDSATTRLVAYVSDAATTSGVPQGQRLVILPIGNVSSASVEVGPRKLFMIGLFLVLFAVWSITTALRPRLVRSWRHPRGAPADA
jgi:hypothetical protein